jgi:RNA polymerase sigma-70 factor (ECF subfamily)
MAHAQQIALLEKVGTARPSKIKGPVSAHSDPVVLIKEPGEQPDLPFGEAHLRERILAFLPDLKAFALSLTHDPVKADDLVQSTVLRAWMNLDQFRRGTNYKAWLFTILRNSFYSEFRKRRREVEDADSVYATSLKVQPEQEFRLLLKDLQRALVQLPLAQREALFLVGGQGETYEGAAAICGVAVGTIKSRVSRARTHLAQAMTDLG